MKAHLFDSLLDSALLIDKNFLFHYCNEAFTNLVEVPHRRLKPGKNITEFAKFPQEFWDKIDERLIVNEPTPYAEMLFKRSSGEKVACQYTIQKVEVDGQTLFLIYFRDVTLEKILHEKYKREISAKEEYIFQLDRKLFETKFLFEISSLINGNTEENIITLALKKACATFGFDRGYFVTPDEGKGASQFRIETLIQGIEGFDGLELGPDLSKELLAPLSAVEATRTLVQIEKGNSQFVLLTVQGKNSILGYIVFERQRDNKHSFTIEDLGLLKVMTQQLAITFDNEILYYKSITDEKTRLYNARYFTTTMRNEVHRSMRTGSPFGLILVDIDHFKKFNDTYGHHLGDQVLKHVAQQIKGAIRNSDIAARYGGEEFAVMMVDTTIDGVQMAAERVRTSIESAGLDTEEFGTLKVTASLGLAICPIHASSEKELINAADRALYQAKRSGRNNVQIFDFSKTP